MDSRFLRRGLVALLLFAAVLLWMAAPPAGTGIRVGQRFGSLDAALSDGKRFRLQEHAGDVVVVNFWASWCQPCRQEAPALNRVHRAGTTLIGLSVEAGTPAELDAQAASFGIEYPVGRADSTLIDRLGIAVIPTTCVLGRDGVVVLAATGAVSDAELDAAIRTAKRR